MVCENCHSSNDGKYGSGRFCSSKCARGFSTKLKRSEINEKVSSSLRSIHGTQFLECSFCRSSFPWNHFVDVAAQLGVSETKFCSKSCKKLAKDLQNQSLESRQKMSDSAVRRLERGDVWFGKQNFVDAFEKTIRCDSLLERSFVLLMSRDMNVKDVKRSDIWISYADGGITRRYNPDFVVEFIDGSHALAEIKSERMGKRDVWDDYRKKSETKRKLLEDYARNHGMKSIWYTQMTSPETYKEACTHQTSEVE